MAVNLTLLEEIRLQLLLDKQYRALGYILLLVQVLPYLQEISI